MMLQRFTSHLLWQLFSTSWCIPLLRTLRRGSPTTLALSACIVLRGEADCTIKGATGQSDSPINYISILTYLLSWYRVRSALIYQVPIVSAIVCILNGILFGTVCDTSKEFQLGSTLLAIINFLSQVLALTSIVGYYRRLRPEFRGTPIMRKFLTYKAMVWLIIHQQLILEIIQFAKVVTPTSGTTEYMSYADFKFGIPEFMLCCETLIFSCLFQWSFAAWPHRKALLSSDVETLHTSHAPDRSLFAYVQALLWPQDIFHEQLAAAKTLIGTFKGADSFDYTAGTGVGFSQRFYSKEGSLSDSHRSFDMPAMTPGVEKSHEQHLLSSNANRQSLRIPSVPEDLNSHSPQTPRQHL